MIVLDTGGLLAALDASEALHGPCRAALLAAPGPRLLSPFVLAELDYLVGKRLGRPAQEAVLAEVARGSYRLVPFGSSEIGALINIPREFPTLALGIADASVLWLARTHRASAILTTDLRHFRAFRGADGRPFRLVPADAQS
jgi:predicted nucleic acid-binding protein